jgi:hypothetical protein
MNSDSSSPDRGPGDPSDNKFRWTEVPRLARNVGKVVTYVYSAGPQPPPAIVQRDDSKRLFVITMPDGTVDRYRDRPVRHLIVEPDPKTGGMWPAIKDGKPATIWLCREEVEA